MRILALLVALFVSLAIAHRASCTQPRMPVPRAHIPVKDLARARQFYEQKLGFKPKAEVAGGVVYDK